MQCQRLLFLSLGVVVFQTMGVDAFVEVRGRGNQGLPLLTSNNRNNNRPMPTLRQAAEDSTKDQAVGTTVNGDASGNGGGLILQADAKSQLFASFSALSLSDQ